jgi:nucleoside-diphosphate-sugar epimerase
LRPWKRAEKTRVLVTGGNGFVGRNLIPLLIRKGCEVVALDIQGQGNAPIEEKIRFVEGSVTDCKLLSKLFKDNDFDVVYHLAAIVGVKRYLEHPFDVVDVNINGTRAVLAECLKFNVNMLFASTSEVFGKNPNVPWNEDDDRLVGNPKFERWLYGNTKAVCEHLLYAAARKLGLQMSIVRYFNLYGPKQVPTNVIPRLICRALLGEPLQVYDDGRMVRCFTFIQDAVEATVLAAESSTGEAFNIGSHEDVSILQLARQIVEKTGSRANIQFVDPRKVLGSGYQDLQIRIPNPKKARVLLGWSASTGLDEGLTDTVKWYRENESWWKSTVD